MRLIINYWGAAFVFVGCGSQKESSLRSQQITSSPNDRKTLSGSDSNGLKIHSSEHISSEWDQNSSSRSSDSSEEANRNINPGRRQTKFDISTV